VPDDVAGCSERVGKVREAAQQVTLVRTGDVVSACPPRLRVTPAQLHASESAGSAGLVVNEPSKIAATEEQGCGEHGDFQHRQVVDMPAARRQLLTWPRSTPQGS